MKKTLNFGIIGYGTMGKIRHQTLNKMEQCEVITVYEYNNDIVTPEKLKRENSVEELIASKNIVIKKFDVRDLEEWSSIKVTIFFCFH